MRIIASVSVFLGYIWKALRVSVSVCVLLLLSDPLSSFLFLCVCVYAAAISVHCLVL